MSIQFEYFYGSQAEQFSFYRIPKVLFTDETLSGISVEAKVLYSFKFILRKQAAVYVSITTARLLV